MRYLLPKDSRQKILTYLLEKNNCNSLKQLSFSLKIPFRTIQEWIYNYKRYVPKKIIPIEIKDTLTILDEKEDNWGRVKGGKKTYQIIIKKYGLKEIRKRQSMGGKKIKQRYNNKIPEIDDSLFLEFYGILLGDGWIGTYRYKNKIINMIGISGHSVLDRNFFIYSKKNIKSLFDRNAYLKERSQQNSIELNFCHQKLFKKLSTELNFPVGKKINLQINKKIYDLGYNKLRHVIRGIFDTDGCFYLDKTPVGRPYPCVSIEMKAPLLIKQIYDLLIKQDFKVGYQIKKDGRHRITLKGRKQLNKWMREIGSSNSKHLDKINALVAQQDSATDS